MADVAETKAEREARWWSDWFEADYTWDGLSKHEIRGGGLHGETTLQDYWRRDPRTGQKRTNAVLREVGELVEFDGRWWHLVHLPLRDVAGVTSGWKADAMHANWPRVVSLVADRLAAARETRSAFNLGGWRPEGRDGRARLDGGVIGPALNHPVSGASPVHLSCVQAWIGDITHASRRFGPGALFESAIFAGDVGFYGAIFEGYVGFHDAIFTRDISFHRANFTSVAFHGATFSGQAGFDDAVFGGDALFDGATFSRDAGFDRATFVGEANFYNVAFSGDASFDRAIFSNRTFFDRASFCGYAFFDGATFSSVARFKNATFEKRSWFSARDDRPGFAAEARASFEDAVFKGAVKFSSTIAEPERSFAGAFRSARFLDIADFSNAVAPDRAGRLAAAFEETQFEKALILTDGADRDARDYFRDVMLPTAVGARDSKRKARLKQLEAGCRTIKIAMGEARDELREQRYYRFQLIARQHRSDIDRWEKAYGWLYGLASDFGSSLWRPLAWLSALTVAAGLGYFAWAVWLHVSCPDPFWEGQGMALTAVFKPFSTLGDTGVAKAAYPSFSAALMAVHPVVAMGVRLATLVQSLLSGVLIFLFALAVKRRFQIS